MLGLMSSLTAALLAAFAGYGAAWYFGFVEGNFSLLLFWLRWSLVFTGWLSIFTSCPSVAGPYRLRNTT